MLSTPHAGWLTKRLCTKHLKRMFQLDKWREEHWIRKSAISRLAATATAGTPDFCQRCHTERETADLLYPDDSQVGALVFSPPTTTVSVGWSLSDTIVRSSIPGSSLHVLFYWAGTICEAFWVVKNLAESCSYQCHSIGRMFSWKLALLTLKTADSPSCAPFSALTVFWNVSGHI